MTPPHRPWQAVGISSSPEQLAELDTTLEAMAAAVGDVPALLAAANQAGRFAPKPGEGQTARLWELLASVAAIDVAAGRILEPHLDAGAILSQARAADFFTGTWGVFAAEAPGTRLTAVPQSDSEQSEGEQSDSEQSEGEQSDGEHGGDVRLSGSKPWCSLAQFVDHAVVTAHTQSGGRAAYAIDLRDAGVTCVDPEWTSRGLREIPSGTVHFDRVPAVPLGGEGWYFQRPGFAWGGMGVAACWLGGAVALGRHFKAALIRGAQSQREPDQVALASLGEVDRILTSAIQYLARTAELIDARQGHAELPEEPGGSRSSGAWSEALRVRGTVAAAVERVQLLVSQNLGPGPLAFDERYGKCMADLSLYVRQHHALRDDAQLGALTLKGEHEW
jgi:hypothetical protein